jgi:hypothetical protein
MDAVLAFAIAAFGAAAFGFEECCSSRLIPLFKRPDGFASDQ